MCIGTYSAHRWCTQDSFCLNSVLRKLVVADGTFEACQHLSGYDTRSAQLYQMSVKFEVGDRCFIYNVAQFICKNRRRSTYDAMFSFLKELYAKNFPDNDPLIILDWHSDYEVAFIGAVQAAFEGPKHTCVSFTTPRVYIANWAVSWRVPTKNRTFQVWTLLKGCPYLPWNNALKRSLLSILHNQVNFLPVRLHEQYLHFVDEYYTKTYFGHGAFTLMNQDTWWYYFDGHDDLTDDLTMIWLKPRRPLMFGPVLSVDLGQLESSKSSGWTWAWTWAWKSG